MRIKLGLGLDGMKPKRIQSTLGEKEVGPIGFLTILETQCGIATVADSTTTRIIQYLACLEEMNTSNRFYQQSFIVDQFNVARTLLQWRDSWYEAGWNGQFEGDVSLRLQDMADIEQLAKERVSNGLGERLQHVLSSLNHQKTQVEQVCLFDSLESFSPLWQQILKHFTVTTEEALKSSAKQGSDLSLLQNSLQQLSTQSLAKGDDGSVNKIKLAGDNSFVVIKARSKAVSARLISQWLTKESESLQDKTVALLASQSGGEIDEALEAVDLPRLGFESSSPWRPVLQVLPIALDLLWAPLNPEILLQFLMHPVGPLIARIRKPLANIVAQSPGIGGEQWQVKLAELLEKEKLRECFTEKDFKQLQAEIKYWFDSERYEPHNGLPIEVAKQRCIKVASWLAQQQANLQDESMRSLFGAAYSQASELNTALTHLLEGGTTNIEPEQLRYLLDQLTGSGTGIVDKHSECLADQSQWLFGTQQADSFSQAVDSVIWWDLQIQGSSSGYAWSSKEIQQLAKQGVLLPCLDKQLQYQAQSWLKPINAATERLVLVLHDSDEAHHPLWDQISSCVENWHEISAEDSVLTAETIASLNGLTSVSTPYTPLPSLIRWWKLESGKKLTKRDKESYSSLENFFYSPYQWVLRYKARLRTGTLQSLSDGNLLKGNLVHHLYEKFFNENTDLLTTSTLDSQKVDQWFDQTMEQLLIEEGAVLLMRGRLVEKEMFISKARQSLHQLIHQLRVANVVTVEMEAAQEALFFGGILHGFIDMKVTNKDGDEALVDIKWGGLKYRKDSLQENKHLQLVTYSYLNHKTNPSKKWPPVAFYIIDGSAMVAQDNRYFPEATDVPPTEDENHAVIWQKMEKTWKWRRQQIEQGLIEVTVTGTESDEDSNAGEDALIIPETSDRFNDYRVLIGWGK